MKNYFDDIFYFFKDVYKGIKNIFVYSKIIYRDRDWDHFYFLELIKFKLQRMLIYFEKSNIVINNDETIKNIQIAIDMIDDFLDDNSFEPNEKLKTLFSHLEKNLELWWD